MARNIQSKMQFGMKIKMIQISNYQLNTLNQKNLFKKNGILIALARYLQMIYLYFF